MLISRSTSSYVFEKLLKFHKCEHCGHVEGDTDEKQGRCADCGIPFCIIKHHAKGNCLRCYNSNMRSNATK